MEGLGDVGGFGGCCQVVGSAQRRELREVWIPSWNGGHMGHEGGLLGTWGMSPADEGPCLGSVGAPTVGWECSQGVGRVPSPL